MVAGCSRWAVERQRFQRSLGGEPGGGARGSPPAAERMMRDWPRALAMSARTREYMVAWLSPMRRMGRRAGLGVDGEMTRMPEGESVPSM